MKKLIYGVGLNDSKEPVTSLINGKRVISKYYDLWNSMIQRCYSEKEKEKWPTYKDCYVCDDWLIFSNFKSWMKKQEWHGLHLDKDLLFKGNKVYSPETCIFVSKELNAFTTDSVAKRGIYPIGVNFHKSSGKFIAQCKNPFTKSRGYIGLYSSPEDAHEAWRKRKHELACQWADAVDDPRLKKALRERYAHS